MATATPVVPLVLFAVGLVGAAVAARQYYRRRRADPYDAVTAGEVRSSDLDPDGAADRADYTPTVRYEYEVDGVPYENDAVRATGGPLSRRGGRVLLGTYEEGATVSVHYDPENPERSVLVPPESGRVWLAVAAAGLLIAGAAALLAL